MLPDILALPILLALASGIAAAMVPRRMSPALAALAAAIGCGLYAVLSWQADAQGWFGAFWGVPALGVAGGLRLDGLGGVFALLITGIGTLIFLYTGRYLQDDPRSRQLVTLLLLFMMAMLGAVTADDVILLFIFWELTSLASFFLVGYNHESLEARKAALQALLVTVAGGLALLAGLLLLVQAAGTTRLSGILAAREAILAAPTATAAMLLILLGCFTKSAQVPFHFWLPSAMAAPTPVSAYLHSATMVKLGIYVMARFSPLFAGEALWHLLLTGFGLATALTGTVLALRATDLKRILAYTTVAALGTLTLLLGIGSPLAIVAALTFLVVHAFYKAGLFLTAGIIDHATGLRDAGRLRGLGRAMPLTALGAGLAALSMAGLPPFLGFLAKELMYEAVTYAEYFRWGAAIGLFLVNAGTVAIAAVLSVRVFAGRAAPTPHTPHDPPAAMLAGPLALGLLSLAAALALPATATRWLEPAAAATLGRASGVEPALWHGFNTILWLSAATLLAGFSLYRIWPTLRPWLEARTAIDRYGATRGYDAALHGLTLLARASTEFFQHGSLRGYIRLLFGAAAAALLLPLVAGGGLAAPAFELAWWDIRYLAFAGLVIGAVAATRARTAFVAVMAVGLVGFATAVIFMLFGAPDVAFTQFSVETLMAVIIATTLARIPIPQSDTRRRGQKRVDAAIAIATGAGVSAILLSILAQPLDTRLSDWFGQYSLLAAQGHNVVNVILVDFRALDTLGEITVLAIAGFGVVALLRSGAARRGRMPASQQAAASVHVGPEPIIEERR
ncbi:MAG: DUF4040 domain-containing protein [Pigmentiphaga sp.]|nr:DUF4040 domain-containing protein [Pigmentiphaga sp.]